MNNHGKLTFEKTLDPSTEISSFLKIKLFLNVQILQEILDYYLHEKKAEQFVALKTARFKQTQVNIHLKTKQIPAVLWKRACKKQVLH